MWFNISIYDSDKHLTLQFDLCRLDAWHEIGTIADGDGYDMRLFGIELFLYEEPEVSVEEISKQFEAFENITVSKEYGLMYVRLRNEPITSPGFGFGRTARIGLTGEGKICLLQIPWNSSGSGTPIVDRSKALLGLPYHKGEPNWS